jgi:hypothetical protein
VSVCVLCAHKHTNIKHTYPNTTNPPPIIFRVRLPNFYPLFSRQLC